MFMYAAQSCDADDMEKGLFLSALLIKVCSAALHRKAVIYMVLWQSFKNIFTSPSSAASVSVLDDLVNSENIPPASKRAKRKGPTRSNVASLIGLKSVTPRTIAYTAVQVC